MPPDSPRSIRFFCESVNSWAKSGTRKEKCPSSWTRAEVRGEQCSGRWTRELKGLRARYARSVAIHHHAGELLQDSGVMGVRGLGLRHLVRHECEPDEARSRHVWHGDRTRHETVLVLADAFAAVLQHEVPRFENG